ncbi:MAG: hypothetical protein KDI88_16460 [Gammaproteobacteria bacterium]|nr:hypothetical protein [Gammaproteobacteria bacterium]
MNLGGLTPDKAPPLEAPLTLFLLLPVFLVVTGALLIFNGDQLLLSRWTPTTLAVTHFLALGTLAPVMCGSLLQVSPVLLGAPYPQARRVAKVTALGLGLGALGIGLGLLWSSTWLLVSGAAAIVAGLGVFLVASYRALAPLPARSPAGLAVRLALLALATAITLGIMLALGRADVIALSDRLALVDVHAGWGLAGWIGLLLAGIGMEIVPMFYVAPAFPRRARIWIPLATFALLVLLTSGGLVQDSTLRTVAIAGLFLFYAGYNLAAFRLEQRRRRPQRDANLWLWQGSHLGVICAAAAWMLQQSVVLVGILLFGSALAFMIGAVTKIVPFISWLDLQQQRIASGNHRVKLPHMQALLPPHRSSAIAVSLLGAVLMVLAGHLATALVSLGGAFLLTCGLLVAYALYRSMALRSDIAHQLHQPEVAPGTANVQGMVHGGHPAKKPPHAA